MQTPSALWILLMASGARRKVWRSSPSLEDTDHFGRHDQTFMLKLRVRDLDAVLSHLRTAGGRWCVKSKKKVPGGSRGSSTLRAVAWSSRSPTRRVRVEQRPTPFGCCSIVANFREHPSTHLGEQVARSPKNEPFSLPNHISSWGSKHISVGVPDDKEERRMD
jgi:hypothetical protein